MAGRGPAPKPAGRRVRTGKEPVPSLMLKFQRAQAPALPEGIDWHPQTVEWWEMWKRSPQAPTFTESDWNFLVDTAYMHHQYWSKGAWTLAAELRLRVAKFGATPEDRARLRMVFADADEKDEKRAAKAGQVSRARRGPLKAV